MSILVLPTVVLVLGVVTGLYLLYKWLKDGRRHPFLLLWAIATFLFYWFYIPFILANAGVQLTVTDFNLFYTFTLPTIFGGLLLIYIGVLTILKPPNLKKILRYLYLWFAASVLFLFYYLIIEGGIIASYGPVFVVNFLFLVPARLFIISGLWKLLRFKATQGAKPAVVGVVLMMGWAAMGIAGNSFAVKRLLAYPPQFWFIAITEFELMYVLQAISLLLLLLGFLLVHKSCIKYKE